MTSRRTLLKCLGAAVVAAPALVVAETKPADREAREAHAEGYERGRAIESAKHESRWSDGYQAGLRAGQAGAIRRFYSVENMAYATVASAIAPTLPK